LWNISDIRTFNVNDTLPPSLTVENPLNNYNYTNATMDLNYTVYDDNLDSCWYINVTGQNVPLTGCLNTTFEANEGSNNITVYANDTSNHIVSVYVAFHVDTLPPVISNITVTVANESATVNWTTDENANSTVSYDLTDALGNSIDDSAFVINHSILITGLDNNTLYYYNITSCDVYGHCSTVGPYNFTTSSNPLPPPNPVPVVVLNSPPNNTVLNNVTNITLGFTVTDNNLTLNCLLYINNSLNMTNGSTQNNTITYFNVPVTIGNYTWRVNCSDGELSGVSQTRRFIIQNCGDGIISGTEQCDGTNLNNRTCKSLGYDTGTLSCSASCQFAGCSNVPSPPGGGGPGGGGGWITHHYLNVTNLTNITQIINETLEVFRPPVNVTPPVQQPLAPPQPPVEKPLKVSYLAYWLILLITVVILFMLLLARRHRPTEEEKAVKELKKYVKKEREAGYTDEQIKQALLQANWKQEIIDMAFKK
jgi:hypothetical protein